MSFDLSLWSGSPAAASRIHDLSSSKTPLPIDQLIAAFQKTFANDVRILPTREILGRGWELSLDENQTVATIQCSWSLSNNAEAIASFIEAANASNCSVFDPQHGAYWPAFTNLLRTEEPWSSAFFDEFYDSEEEEDLVLRTEPMRLCPDAFEPAEHVKIALDLHKPVPSLWLRTFISLRARTYRTRFVAESLSVVLHGDAAHTLDRTDVEKWLRHTKNATPIWSAEETTGSIAFAVSSSSMKASDALAIVERIDPCPFELLVVSEEERFLLATFEEDPLAMFVVIPRRAIRAAPSIVRSALAALHSGVGDHNDVRYVDLSGRANEGSTLNWLEALIVA